MDFYLTNLISYISVSTMEQFVKKPMYKMMFAFEARNPDELTLAEGDIVQVSVFRKCSETEKLFF